MVEAGDLERRVLALEESVDALMGVVNHLLEMVYDKRFISKLEKASGYGKSREEEGE